MKLVGLHDKNQIRALGKPATRAVILGPGDIVGFLRNVEIDPDTVPMSKLGDHLEDHMPDSADETLVVPSYPYGVHVPLGKRTARLFTLCTENPVIREEREAAKKLTAEFFDLDSQAVNGAWPEWDYMTEIWLARSSRPGAAERFTKFLDETAPGILPPTIELGGAVLEDRA